MGGSKKTTNHVDNTIVKTPSNVYDSPVFGQFKSVANSLGNLNSGIGNNLDYYSTTPLNLNYDPVAQAELTYLPETALAGKQSTSFDPIIQNAISQSLAGLTARQNNNDRTLSQTLSRSPGSNQALLSVLRGQARNQNLAAQNTIYPQALSQQRDFDMQNAGLDIQRQNLLQSLVQSQNANRLASLGQYQSALDRQNATRLEEQKQLAAINSTNNQTKLTADQLGVTGNNALLQNLLELIKAGSVTTQTEKGVTSSKTKNSII